jgi:MFS family permease
MTDTQLSRAGSMQAPPARLRSPLPVLIMAVFAVVLDFFVVNAAVPAIEADLHASSAATEWIVAGYGLAFAVLIITGGRLGDRRAVSGRAVRGRGRPGGRVRAR